MLFRSWEVFISELESAEERDKFQVGQPALLLSTGKLYRPLRRGLGGLRCAR